MAMLDRSMNRRLWLRVLFALALTAESACGGAAQRGAREPGDPAAQDPMDRPVRSFVLAGNQVFSDSAIRAKLYYGAAEGRVYRPAMLELDEQRVEAFYRDRGYFSTRAQAQVTRATARAVDIVVSIQEGEPTRVASIEVTGVPAEVGARTQEVFDFVELRRDEPLVYEEYVAAKERMTQVLAQAGYIYAQVDGTVRVDREQRTAAIELRVAPGPRARFGEVTIRGNRRIPTSAISARVEWDQGEVFNLDKLRETRKNLFELGMFRSVRVDYDKSERTSVVDVAIVVRESERHELKLGGGVAVEGAGGIFDPALLQTSDTRLEVHGRSELTIHSWLDPLMTLHLGFTPGYVVLPGASDVRAFVFEARAAVERQDFVLPRVTLGVVGSYALEGYEAYSAHGPRASVVLDRLFWSNQLPLALGAELEHLTITPVEGIDLAALGTGSALGVASLHQTAKLDHRDELLNPRTGWFVQLRLQEGRWFRTVSGRYLKGLVDMRGYVPLGERVVLAGRTRGGYLAATVTGAPPVSQRFFSGGSYHRGFGARRLAPVVPGENGITVPVGGSKLVEASVDVRFDVVEIADYWLGGVVFVDAGDVVAAADELELLRLHVAAGAGLRYQTPIGAIRFDIARRLNRLRPCGPERCPDPDPYNPLVFHFSVGEAF